MQFMNLPVCILVASMLSAHARVVPVNTPLSTDRMGTSAIVYKCHEDYCTWEKYCDHRSRRCEYCTDRLSECFTPAQDANCTMFCMKRRPCPALPQLEHGVHNGSDMLVYWFGDKVTFQCLPGYHNSGQQDTVCLDFGDWSHRNLSAQKQPFCQVNLCEVPRAPDNGRFEFTPNTTEFQVGSRIVFGCADGFGPIGGNTTRTCLSDGTWDGILPKCIANRCPLPQTPLNGRMDDSENITNNSVGTEIAYSCNEGYELKGRPSIQCQQSGQWDGQPPVCAASTCSIPCSPPNGRVDYPDNITHFSAGTKVTYSCNDGYVLRGQSSRECLPTGQWKGQPPDCKVNSCKPPVTHVNGGVQACPTIFTTDMEITHICNDGFEMKGDSKQRCLSNGLWAGDVPVCIEKKWYKNPFIWIIIGLVFSSTSVLFICCVCKRGREQHTTTYNKCEIEEKETETKRLDEQTDLVGEAESAVPELCESVELVNITEEGKNLRSLRQKNATPTAKMVPPRHASVSSTGTMETNVTTTDDESTSAKYPAKEQSTTSQTAIYQMNNVTNNFIYGERNTVINEGSASVSSDDETDSPSPRDVTVHAIKETSMDADKRPESKPLDDTVSDDGSTDDGNNLIAQETGLAQYDKLTRC